MMINRPRAWASSHSPSNLVQPLPRSKCAGLKSHDWFSLSLSRPGLQLEDFSRPFSFQRGCVNSLALPKEAIPARHAVSDRGSSSQALN